VIRPGDLGLIGGGDIERAGKSYRRLSWWWWWLLLLLLSIDGVFEEFSKTRGDGTRLGLGVSNR